jgi:hypothetical protein
MLVAEGNLPRVVEFSAPKKLAYSVNSPVDLLMELNIRSNKNSRLDVPEDFFGVFINYRKLKIRILGVLLADVLRATFRPSDRVQRHYVGQGLITPALSYKIPTDSVAAQALGRSDRRVWSGLFRRAPR